MKKQYAVISDIHGLGDQFEVVLDKLKRKGITKFLILGDLIGYGPQPIKVVDLVFGLIDDGYDVYVVKGNHDAVLEKLELGMSFKEVQSTIRFNSGAAAAAYWTTKVIREHQNAEKYVNFITNLPETLAVPGTSAVVVHGSYHVREGGHHYNPYLLNHDEYDWERHIKAFKRDYPQKGKNLIFHGHTHFSGLAIGKKNVRWNKPWWSLINLSKGGWHDGIKSMASGGIYTLRKKNNLCVCVNPGGGLPRNYCAGRFQYAIVTENRKHLTIEWLIHKFDVDEACDLVQQHIGDFEFGGINVSKHIKAKITNGG